MADVVVHSRYLRDCSFENPSAPAPPDGGLPELDIEVGVDCRRCGDLHEVTLTVTLTARRQDRAKVAWLSEVHP